MAVSKIKATVAADIDKVWDAVLKVDNYIWRSDLSKTEILNENQFVEYTKSGYPTVFTVTASVPRERLEFDIDNTNMKGHWVGIFNAKGNETEIEFTEYITVKKFFMKPFVKLYLKRQQGRFVSDLKKYCCL